MINLIIKANKKHYPQTLLEECRYIKKTIKTENHINEDLEIVDQIVNLITRLNLILIVKNNSL